MERAKRRKYIENEEKILKRKIKIAFRPEANEEEISMKRRR